jgi:hypothetical protein
MFYKYELALFIIFNNTCHFNSDFNLFEHNVL